MSRHPDPGFDPRIADWLEADPDHAPPEVLRTVESALPSIPQRRVLRLPWRNLPMNRPVLVLATVGLLAVLGIGAVTVGSRPSTTTPTAGPDGAGRGRGQRVARRHGAGATSPPGTRSARQPVAEPSRSRLGT